MAQNPMRAPAARLPVDPKRLALFQGIDDTRRALARWQNRPLAVVAPWLVRSLAIAALLLGTVGVIAALSVPDPTRLYLPGYHGPARLTDYLHILLRNSLVLALHALACVAGFIAGSSLPLQARHHRGLKRLLHERAGPAAMVFVGAATCFSLATQAYVLGGTAATLAAQLGIGRLELIVSLLPHAVPELTALFLPLAAWLTLGRQERWHELLAATLVCVALAVPVLLASGAAELTVWPRLIELFARG